MCCRGSIASTNTHDLYKYNSTGNQQSLEGGVIWSNSNVCVSSVYYIHANIPAVQVHLYTQVSYVCVCVLAKNKPLFEIHLLIMRLKSKYHNKNVQKL